MKKKTVYLAVTADELELPICFAFDTEGELADWFGKPQQKIDVFIKTGKKDDKENCKYIKVEISTQK